jgi:hypothetical protein
VIDRMICDWAQMESYAIIEPVLGPARLGRNPLDRTLQPLRPWLFKRRHIGIFGCETEIARQHQCGATIDNNLQSCARRSCQQLVAIQCAGHVYRS